MGHIRETKLKKGGSRYQAEVRLKGMPKALTAVFDRKSMLKLGSTKPKQISAAVGINSIQRVSVILFQKQ